MIKMNKKTDNFSMVPATTADHCGKIWKMMGKWFHKKTC